MQQEHKGNIDDRVQTVLVTIGNEAKLGTSHCLIQCYCSVGRTVKFRSSDWHNMPEHAAGPSVTQTSTTQHEWSTNLVLLGGYHTAGCLM